MLTAFATALGMELLLKIGEKGLEQAADGVVASGLEKTQQAIRQHAKQGSDGVIQAALQGAQADLQAECRTAAERAEVEQVLNTLLNSKRGPLMQEFARQVAQLCLLERDPDEAALALARLYRKFAGLGSLIRGEVLGEAALSWLLGAYFAAFRERLLRTKEFAHLRDYASLHEARKQTDLSERMLATLEAIAANTAHPVADSGAARVAYLAYLIHELKDHTIRGFAPRVSGRELSLPLAEIFLPLQAIEEPPAQSEYALQDLQQQAEALRHATQSGRAFDWQRREELEKRAARLAARQSVRRTLALADLVAGRRAVLLGDPGSGKTTVTRYLAYALAAGDLTNTGESAQGLVPILVRIATYAKLYEADPALHLDDYIERHLTSRPEYGRFLRGALADGECMVILDGLDEVGDLRLRTQITDCIRELISSYSANRFLITSRIIGYHQAPLSREFIDIADAYTLRYKQLWGARALGALEQLLAARRAVPAAS